MNYLNNECPDRELEIVAMYETGVGGFMFSRTPVIRNEVMDKMTGQSFQVDVLIRDLTIYK